MSTSHRGVQIEVLDEEEYALEQQREREEHSERRQKELAAARQARAAAASAAIGASSSAQVAPAAAAPAASSTDDSASGSASGWTSVLGSLRLPAFFSTLHDTRVYDDSAYRTLLAHDTPAFHHTALSALKQALELLDDGVPAPSRSTVVQLMLACLRFLLPPLPPTPPALGPTDLDDDALASSAHGVGPFEYVWQMPDLSLAAARLLERLAVRTSDATSSEASTSESPPLGTLSPAVDALLAFAQVRALLAQHLASLLTALRQEMRGGSESINAPWKSAERFPSPFLISSLLAYAPRAALAVHVGDVVPLLLPLVDDHELRFKVCGLAALQRLLQLVPGSAYASGAGLLLVRSLKTCLSFRDRAVLALAVPTFVQAYMTFFPTVLIHDDEVIEKLAIAEGLKELPTTHAPASFTVSAKGKVAFTGGPLTPVAASVDLRDRVGAQAQLMQTLLAEALFYTLSPSADNAFALFVCAQAMLPALLYVGPFAILPNLQQLLSLLTTWACFSNTHQTRTCTLAWQTLEALLEMTIVAERTARHASKLLETAATAWIQGIEVQMSVQHALTAPTTRVADQHPCASSIVNVVRRLHALNPTRFEEIWKELRTMSELVALNRAIDKGV